ncbi:MAG TPA: MlaD family protein [Thermoleophilaceae bacterium]|nr:MlaD family protein [Thermoleophilaceae bacterium]
MALFRKKKHPQDPGMSRVKAGLIAIVVIGLITFFGFTKYNPFASPYTLTAMFRSANGIKANAPVRIAGVNVGKVTGIKAVPGGQGAAKVTMQISSEGLPIHKDATAKIRERIFLEGNEFVDLQPGSPSAPVIKKGSGYTIPIQQTATPVQVDQLLTALQSDTRKNLQMFLKEYSQGLADGGAQGFNKAVRAMPSAYRYGSLANEATLGTQPHDLSTVEEGQGKVFRALDVHEPELKSLITNFNVTANAFAREDQPLEQAIPALDATLRVGTPALQRLNGALPALRSFARTALPATKSSGPTIDASMPFVTQARRLVSQQELKGLTQDLLVTMPSLSKLNHDSIPLLEETRQLSACQNNVLIPFANTTIPDPDFPKNSGKFYQQVSRTLPGLAGESRISDPNSGLFHIEVGAGPLTIAQTDGAGQQIFGQSTFPIEATRPAKPDSRPVDRPNVPCETQLPPDLHAPTQVASSGGIDQTSTTPLAPTSAMAPDVAKAHNEALAMAKRISSSVQRMQKGEAFVDPLTTPNPKQQEKQAKKLGLTWQGNNLVDLRTGK